MRYVMLIYGEPGTDPQPDTPEAQQMFVDYAAYSQEVKSRGAFQAGEGLQPVATATTVRVRDGEVLTTDGPFAETKEELGGFYLLSCKDLDEAIELAAKIPHSRFGSIEIRPVWEVPEAP